MGNIIGVYVYTKNGSHMQENLARDQVYYRVFQLEQ